MNGKETCVLLTACWSGNLISFTNARRADLYLHEEVKSRRRPANIKDHLIGKIIVDGTDVDLEQIKADGEHRGIRAGNYFKALRQKFENDRGRLHFKTTADKSLRLRLSRVHAAATERETSLKERILREVVG